MRLKKNKDFNTTDYSKLKISDLKSMADYWFRHYLISSTEKRGSNIWCAITEGFLPEDKLHVCHYIDRSTYCTRYDTDNCIIGSANSNLYESKIPHENSRSLHHYKLEQILGKKKVKKLIDKSKEICILQRRDYVELIEKFRNV